MYFIFELSLVPTSAPLAVAVEDVNDSSLTIKWNTPETIGDSGLDGYTIEYCKDGSKLRECTRQCSCSCRLAHSQRADRLRIGHRSYMAGSMSTVVTVSPQTTFSFACLLRWQHALWNFITKHASLSSLFVNLRRQAINNCTSHLRFLYCVRYKSKW